MVMKSRVSFGEAWAKVQSYACLRPSEDMILDFENSTAVNTIDHYQHYLGGSFVSLINHNCVMYIKLNEFTKSYIESDFFQLSLRLYLGTKFA